MPDTLSNTTFFGHDQHLTEEGIAACAEAMLYDKDYDTAPLREAGAHLESCETCRREVVELYGLIATLPAEKEQEEPEEEDTEQSSNQNAAPRPNPVWRWALVAVTALLAFLLYYNARQTTPPSAPEGAMPTPEQLLNPAQQNQPDRPVAETEQSEQTPVQPETQELYAANFEPSEQLEGLAGETMRSAGVEALSPSNSQRFQPGSKVTFQWQQQTPESLQLILLDNRGKELLRQEIAAGNFEWKAPNRPGLYYWKLENAEELLHVGKFLLK